MEVDNEMPPLCHSVQNGFASAKRLRTEGSLDQASVNCRCYTECESACGVNSGTLSNKRSLPLSNNFTDALNSPKRRKFLPIAASDCVFHSEDVRPKGETLYVPLKDDLLINTRNIEQFTFTRGSFFVGDECSRFSRTVQGNSLNMWRFDETTRKLYVARSFVFTNLKDFNDINKRLDEI